MTQFVTFSADGKSVSSWFACAQIEPPPGYAEVADGDARVRAYLAAQLGAQLIDQATRACAFVDRQVIPDETHRTAYANAATIVFANEGKAPSSDPAKTVFGAQAASLGLSADAYAAVVQEVALVSLQLATILSTLRGAVSEAKTSADLAAALTEFETSINDLVTALNSAGLTITVAAPAAIVIPGING